MHDFPSAELLESTHVFPCVYMYKVIGENEAGFVARVREAVQRELPDDHEPAVNIRHTTSGRHLCVTIEPRVPDAAHVLAIYEHLYALEGLVMVW